MDAYRVFKKTFSFEFYTPVLVGENMEYRIRGSFKGILSPGAANSYLFTDEALEFGGVVREMRDAKGTPVFMVNGFEYDMYVTASEPTFDVFGNVNGYRQTLNRNAPIAHRGVVV